MVKSKSRSKSNYYYEKVYKTKRTSKYQNRPSPAYPAQEFCGKKRKGNDGNFWKSVPDKNGVCHWKRCSTRKINKKK